MNRKDDGSQPVPIGESLDPARLSEHQQLRRPIIHGLLRDGETMSLIAPYDTGKSWMAIDLALAIATGEAWLGSIPCEAGRVLYIDSELHAETFTQRLLDVAAAKKIDLDRVSGRFDVLTLRCSSLGNLRIGEHLDFIEPESYSLIIIDSFEPFMFSESYNGDSSAMCQSSTLFRLAHKLRCALVLTQHIRIDDAPNRSILDIARPTNDESFATDTIVAIRSHHADNAVVMQAASRSWPALPPRCFRWRYPLWQPDDSLDPARPGSAEARKRRARARRSSLTGAPLVGG